MSIADSAFNITTKKEAARFDAHGFLLACNNRLSGFVVLTLFYRFDISYNCLVKVS
jgi:hypothetical protein